MKTKYNTYSLKEKDTLISISKELNKTPIEVAGFHNIFADEDNYIGTTFPSNLKELYVPLSINIKELEHTPKVNFDYDSHLSLKPSKKVLLYQVEKEIVSKSNTYTLKFKTEIIFIKNSGVNFVFDINKLDRKKDSSLDTILYNLLEELDQVFYPLQLLISEKGELLEITNHNEILKNWSTLKTELQEKYEGEVIENYIKYYEKNITDKIVLEKMLFKETFINTYFYKLYTNYTSTHFIEFNYCFPVISKIKNIDFVVKQSVNPFLSDDNKVEIEISGKSIDKRTQLDFDSNLDDPFFMESETNNLVEGNFDAKYLLNPESKIIESVTLSCDLLLENPKKINLSIILIEM
ncbi:hypothetical protein FLGE108171_13195 [Flavobacterium gelidilacus]|uniref:hypothetical protein n=1 Tax=Flavobacterium gelidilacus TaxID=206041 RepID=UPI00040DD292|nr:hypothetical protein [Flavobacterium gelidilacus]